jgi:hypothetical protein
MSGSSEKNRLLSNAALALALLSVPISVVLVLAVGSSGPARIAISLAFVSSLAAIGAFGILRGIVQWRPLTIASSAWVILPILAFARLTMQYHAYWWGRGILGDCDDDTALAVVMLAVTPAAVSVLLGALAIQRGAGESRPWTVAKGMAAVLLGIGLGCLEALGAYGVATWA